MPTVEITATTTKGKSVKITVDMESETVEDLKHKICAKINGLDETDVKIVYRAKPLFDEQVPLAKAGVRAGGTVTVIAQARHLGGAPRAAGQALKVSLMSVWCWAAGATPVRFLSCCGTALSDNLTADNAACHVPNVSLMSRLQRVMYDDSVAGLVAVHGTKPNCAKHVICP
jgi:hypothetical protein